MGLILQPSIILEKENSLINFQIIISFINKLFKYLLEVFLRIMAPNIYRERIVIISPFLDISLSHSTSLWTYLCPDIFIPMNCMNYFPNQNCFTFSHYTLHGIFYFFSWVSFFKGFPGKLYDLYCYSGNTCYISVYNTSNIRSYYFLSSHY